MGTDWKQSIDDKDFTPQQISAFILQKLKRDAEAYLGGRGFGFVRLQQLATEHLLNAR